MDPCEKEVEASSTTNGSRSFREDDDEVELEKESWDGYLSDGMLQNRIENVRELCSLALGVGVNRNVFTKAVEELLALLRSGSGGEPRRKRPRREQERLEEVPFVEVSEEGRLKTSILGMETALSNDLILKKIFQYLSVKDLKDCKLVNQVWNRISNESLSGRNTFIASNMFRRWDTSRGEENGRGPWDELRTCLETNTKDSQSNWCAPGIIIDSNALHNDPPARGFLESFGQSMKRLRITNLRHLMSPLTWNLLEKDLPNLVTLQLMDSNFVEVGICPLLPEGVLLPALKTLRMPTMPEISSEEYNVAGSVVRAILSAAVNLKLVENFNPCFTEDLARLNKLPTVRCLDLKLTEAESSGAFLATVFPCLKRVRVTIGTEAHAEWDRINGTLDLYKDVFSRWADTVEELEIPLLRQLYKNLSGRMPNLRVLTLSDLSKIRRVPLFFGCEGSEQVFPALREICLEMGYYHFPSGGTSVPTGSPVVLSERSFPQVKTLRIKGDSKYFLMLTPLDIMFPNLTSLHVHWMKHDKYPTEDDYTQIWRLEFLTRLEIIDLSLGKFATPDSFITGLDSETCRKLQNDPKLEQFLIFFRKRNSISRLRGLRQFKLVLSDVLRYEGKEIGILSHVSHFYGFGCVPNLEVVICYNFRHAGAPRIAKAIEGIRPFVTVVHEELK